LNLLLKIGRQELDTPFADSDDIAMIPNSFEAAIFTSNYLANSSIFLGYIKRWAASAINLNGLFKDKIQQQKRKRERLYTQL